MAIRAALGIMLALAAACSRTRPVECAFFPSGPPAACAAAPDGGIVLTQTARPEFGSDGLTTLVVGKRDLYLARRDGRMAPVLRFDNGPDPLVEGLARTLRDGKIGFLNPSLETVIPPVWDFAFPFENGRAIVCRGCTLKADGEHTSVEGGQWGAIDRTGMVVVPLAQRKP
jgi:hypothetical protein